LRVFAVSRVKLSAFGYWNAGDSKVVRAYRVHPNVTDSTAGDRFRLSLNN